MSLVHFEQAVPRSWEQFEELCADIFQSDWKDPAIVRHGRAGQRQDGVDIVARYGAEYPVGLQCKRRKRWPVSRLTKKEIDKEVAAAKGFKPELKRFYVLTTAQDDVGLQAHIRTINAAHAQAGLFEVVLLGWDDLVRRALLDPQVAQKHFGPSGAGAPSSPLLASWMMERGLLTMSAQEFELSVQELALDVFDWPDGHIVVRHRESDELALQINAGLTGPRSEKSRRARIKLRQVAQRLREEERLASEAVLWMLTDADIAGWLLSEWRPELGATVKGFLERHVAQETADAKRNPEMYLRLFPPGADSHWISTGLTEQQVLEVQEREQVFFQRFQKHLSNDVLELPPSIRSGIALPAQLSVLFRRLRAPGADSVDEFRQGKLFELGLWKWKLA